MPQPTQPEGEMKVPKKQRSKVALWAWKVQASEACCVGSVMHFRKVFVAVMVEQCAESTMCRWEVKRKKKKRRGILGVKEERRGIG